MPRYRGNLKSMLVEALLLVVVLTVVGHLSVSFWEKYFIQSELTQVKTSLQALKKTIINIGCVYDKLYKEISVILDLDKKYPPPNSPAPVVEQKLRNKYTLDRRRLQDIHINTAEAAKNVKIKPRILKKYNNDNAATQSMPEKDVATITRNPLKAAAIEVDLSHENCKTHHHYYTNDGLEEVCSDTYVKSSWNF